MKFLVLVLALFSAALANPVTNQGPNVGGLQPLDVHDAHLLEVLTEVEMQINQQLNSPYYHKVLKVIAAQSQVVSGTRYLVNLEMAQTQCLKEKVTKENRVRCDAFANVQVCTVEIWSQSWLHHTEIIDTKCDAPKAVPAFYSGGGLQHLDVNSAELKVALSEVEPAINDRLDSSYYHRVGQVLKAEYQIVSGTLFHVTFELGQTQCHKEKVTKDTVTACGAFINVQICHAKIWSRPWLHQTEITEMTCQAKPAVPVPGGRQVIDVEDKAMRAALATVESQMSNALNSPFVHTVTKVTKATSQVVAGVLYHVSFEFGQTKCIKTQPIAQEDCRSQVTLSHHCHADILVQSWRNNIQLSNFHCDN